MPRRPRLHIPGAHYHVTLRGNHRQDIFFRDNDRRLLDRYVAEALDPTRVRIHAYCWMTNHIHLLVQVSNVPLGAFIQRIGTRYARAVQRRIPTTGHLFQCRHHAMLVDVDTYFLQLLRYIHLNPVRAGLVGDPGDYPWSSHHAYLGTASTPWVEVQFGLRMFDADTRTARVRYQAYVAEQIGAPRNPGLYAGHPSEPRVLGDDGFIGNMPTPPPPPAAAATSLAEIADGVCRELGVTFKQLQSGSQQRVLTRARGLISARALAAGVGSISDVARLLNRSPSAVARAEARHRPQS